MITREYKALTISENLGSELTALGNQGWALTTIHGGIAWLMRSKAAASLKDQADAHATERGDR
jgi:hypothetical protein